MANRVPLIVDTTTLNIKELPAGDSLDLTNSGIVNAGVITATSFSGSLTGIGTGADKIKVVDESSDTSCNVIYATDPVGYFEPKSGSNLTFNSNTGQLNATIFSGTTVSATTGTFTGNVSVGGTLTYEDVTNQDVLGLSTFRSGIRINTGGINVTAGISTFGALVDVNNRIDVVGGATVDQLNVAGVSTFGGVTTLNEDVTFTGANANVVWDKSADSLEFADATSAYFGDGLDLRVWHNGTDSYIQNATNVLRINNDGTDLVLSTDDNIHLRVNGTEEGVKIIKNAATELYFNDTKRFETRTDGAAVVGILTASGLNVVTGVSTFHNDIFMGDSDILRIGGSSDLQLYHDGNSHVSDRGGTGGLWIESNNQVLIKQNDANHYMAKFYQGAQAELYHNNGVRVTTTADGTDIGGTGAVGITKGTTGQRPGSPAAGDFRYNTTTEKFEGYTTKWGAIGGGTEEVDNIVSQTTATGVGTMSAAEYRAASVKALIQQGTNYQVGRYLMIHDNSTVTVVEESAVATGSMLGSFDGVISGGNAVLRVTMVSAASTAVVTTLIDKITI